MASGMVCETKPDAAGMGDKPGGFVEKWMCTKKASLSAAQDRTSAPEAAADCTDSDPRTCVCAQCPYSMLISSH